MKFELNNPMLKKVFGIASVLLAGAIAVSNALSDQQKEQDLENLKKTVSDLQDKMKG